MSVSTFGTTGDKYIDGLLMGTKWASSSFTYSFPTSSYDYEAQYGSREPSRGFEPLNDAQKTATVSILNMYAAVANVSFSLAPTASQAMLRFAESDVPSTAWAYYPSTWPEGGDVWFNRSKGWYNDPVKGNYAHLTFIHEIGHALGLKHPHEVSGSFNALPTDKDSLEYTVMSYRSYIGASTTTGYTNETWGYPQSLMMYDIAALQIMYGANYTTNSTSTTYKWDPGQTRIFETVWDGGGTADTYDFSSYRADTSLKVDLRPGYWTTTSSSQLAHLGNNNYAIGNIANALLYRDPITGAENLASLIENAIGGQGADTITGNQANNALKGNGGNDLLDGREGADTAVFSGAYGEYTFSVADGTVKDNVEGRDGTDKLVNIEYAQFSNGVYDFSSGIFTATTTPTTTTTTQTSTDTQTQTTGTQTSIPGKEVTGDNKNNTLTGGAGDDTIRGLAGNDKLQGNGGNDRLDGGSGTDIAIYSGANTEYTVRKVDGVWTVIDNVAGRDGSDTLISIEKLQFTNGTVLLSSGSATASGSSRSTETALGETSRLETPENMPVPVDYIESFDFSLVTSKGLGSHGRVPFLKEDVQAAGYAKLPAAATEVLQSAWAHPPDQQVSEFYGLGTAGSHVNEHSALWMMT
jgi:serralysin